MNRKERRARGIDIGDTAVKYGGRTLVIKLFVNTDESVEQVLARVVQPAKGPGQRMVLASGGELDRATAEQVWASVIPAAEQQAKSGGES